MHLGDVVDQFLDENGLAHAGTAEEADFTTLGVRGEKVDHLDAGHEDFRRGGLLGKFRGIGVDRAMLIGANRAFFINRVANDVHDPAKRRVADRHGDRASGVRHFLTAHQAFGGVHRDGADCVFTQMLGHFEDQGFAIIVGVQRVQDLRQVIFELHVHDGADDLGHFAFCVCHVVSPGCL